MSLLAPLSRMTKSGPIVGQGVWWRSSEPPGRPIEAPGVTVQNGEQSATTDEKFMLGEAAMMGLALAGCLEARGHSHDHFSATLQRIHRL
jgi:hypothetical protein